MEIRKSIVQVYFKERNTTLGYYNDQFDLHRGDLVYVDGKLEGLQGQVKEVAYNFRIKISDYHRVIALVDTSTHGKFYLAGSHLITFDRDALPACKAVTWFKAPEKEEAEYVTGVDEKGIQLNQLDALSLNAGVAERGSDYYVENRVQYLCLDGTKGYAIVTGTKAYEVEFSYADGEIRNLTCPCYCSYLCKHEVAVLLQLKETLALIDKRYADGFAATGYFATICKSTFFSLVTGNRDWGEVDLAIDARAPKKEPLSPASSEEICPSR